MISTNKSDYILLYGFSTATMQKPYAWKQRKATHERHSIWTSILTETENNDFVKALTQSGIIPLGEKTFTSPELVERPIVLSNDGHVEKLGPISEYRKLIEFWNVQKRELFQKIKDTFGTDGKELYYGIKELFNWASEECGIDFLSNGYRFGNFEFYLTMMYAGAFEIDTHKECGLTKTTIRKKQIFKNNFIVNCTAECRERSIINQSKIFTPEESSLDFISEEPMSRIVIQIWDEEKGCLAFSQNISLMMETFITPNFSSTQYHIRDSWTEKLLASAANRSDSIKNQIERVSRTTQDKTIHIKSGTYINIDAAITEGNSLFYDYRHRNSQGAFVRNQQKDGEINSFIKIREYIEQTSVVKVIIADPFFSVRAAAKILTRIQRTNVQIDIITSLGKTDPDTGAQTSICEDYRKFLLKNAAILHNNLCVYNLKRGDKQVFHDRYLIRYFNNGIIDGFLLSNSLNSMGQFYPFIIAPMEYEVCMEVCDYLNSMCDSTEQSKLPKKNQITCDILFDSKAEVVPSLKSVSESLPLNTWLAHWCDAGSNFSVPPKDIPAAVHLILNHWNEDKKLSCQTLCDLDSIICPPSSCDLADTIKEIDGVIDSFLEVFIPLSKEKEGMKNHIAEGLESPEYQLWALLNGAAKPCRQGFSLLFEQSGHIWYPEDNWLHGGYNLLLWLHPTAYVELMEEIKSPLMFDILAFRMLCYPWLEQLFYTIAKTGSLYTQLICAEWILEQLKLNKLSIEQVETILTELASEKRVLQAVHLISEITFYIRTSPTAKKEFSKWDSISTCLLKLIASDITECAPEVQIKLIFWLHDCENVSNCKLHLRLSETVTKQPIKNALLDEAIEIAKRGLLDCSYNKDVSELISLYLQCTDDRYGKEAEKMILEKFVDWNVFETAVEPELKNYAFSKWNSACIRAQWQMEILRAYHKQHPEAAKTKQWIAKWEVCLKNS